MICRIGSGINYRWAKGGERELVDVNRLREFHFNHQCIIFLSPMMHLFRIYLCNTRFQTCKTNILTIKRSIHYFPYSVMFSYIYHSLPYLLYFPINYSLFCPIISDWLHKLKGQISQKLYNNTMPFHPQLRSLREW